MLSLWTEIHNGVTNTAFSLLVSSLEGLASNALNEKGNEMYEVKLEIDSINYQVLCVVEPPAKGEWGDAKTFCAKKDGFSFALHRAWRFSEGVAFGIKAAQNWYDAISPSQEQWEELDEIAAKLDRDTMKKKAKEAV